MNELNRKQCLPCEGSVTPLTSDKAKIYLSQLPAGWTLIDEGRAITKHFHFKNYYETIAFVNAIAWLSHKENHHPDLTVSYNYCEVRYSTHAINGLSENDFICAAKVSNLYQP